MMNPVNQNATKEAKTLLTYLDEISGKAIITGQHTQTNSAEEISYLKKITGREPKLRGFELLGYSPNINFNDASEDGLTEVYENQGTAETALQWAKENDGIVTFTFHWFSPVGGRDKSFYSEHTDFNPDRIFIPNTPEEKAFYRDLDIIAEILETFAQEQIPILWRPFHEADGKWFWWGRNGHSTGRELYKKMFEYYVHVKHLDHLIWVWNSPVKEGYPGDDYVDVISRDVYIKKDEESLEGQSRRSLQTDYKKEYEELIEITSTPKVCALAEVDVIPDASMLLQSHIPWAYYMTWSKDFCLTQNYNTIEHTRNMYESEYSISL